MARIQMAVYFAAATLFTRTITIDEGPLTLRVPDLATFRPVPLAIAAVGALLLLTLRWPVLRVLALSAALGLAAGLTGLPVH